MLSGAAWVAATATPSSPTSTICVVIVMVGRAATTRKRRLTRLPPPETGAPSLPTKSSCTPPGFMSTFGVSPDGARSPGSALTSCSAAGSNPTCVRMRPSTEVEASLTDTLTSSPTLAVSGPSIVTFGFVSAAAPCAAAVASAASASTGLLAAAFASGAAAASAAGGGGGAAASMRDGTARGPLGAAGALPTALPPPNDTPPGVTGPAADAADPAAAPLANGTERDCDSLPYQNSVVSLEGRPCVRMTRGVIDSTISFLSRVVPLEPNSRPRIGRSPSKGICVELRWSLSWISPASTCVSPSLSSSSVLVLRVPISYASVVPPLPIGTLICLMIELTSSATLIATLPSLWIVGWTSSVRPTSMYCTLLVENAPPTVALVPEVTTGRRLPTRILAFSLLRARTRGLDSTLLMPTCFAMSTLTPSEETAIVWLFCLAMSDSTRPATPLPAVWGGLVAEKLTLVG